MWKLQTALLITEANYRVITEANYRPVIPGLAPIEADAGTSG
jgi:hypothetical protein